jgi:peptide/nickel transport system permease protein
MALVTSEATPILSEALRFRPFRRDRSRPVPWNLLIPGSLLAALLGCLFILPLIHVLPPPVGGNLLQANLGPFARGHIFGTDSVGDDILSRIIYGGRTDIEVAVTTIGLGMILGGSVGMIAGYFGGVTDSILMRVIDVVISMPPLLLALVISEAMGPSQSHVVVALLALTSPGFARLTRARVLRLRQADFIVAARLSGSSSRFILLRHLVPSTLPQLYTFALMGIGTVVLIEGGLSFLGFGIPPPAPSWGNMIAGGQQVLSSQPSLVLIPSIFLFVTVVLFNRLGDVVRVRLNE